MRVTMRYNTCISDFKKSNLQKKSKHLPLRANTKRNFYPSPICTLKKLKTTVKFAIFPAFNWVTYHLKQPNNPEQHGQLDKECNFLISVLKNNQIDLFANSISF